MFNNSQSVPPHGTHNPVHMAALSGTTIVGTMVLVLLATSLPSLADSCSSSIGAHIGQRHGALKATAAHFSSTQHHFSSKMHCESAMAS
jgi:hypothetical protein